MDRGQYVSLYNVLKKDIILIILIFSYLISLGISWIIPTPTYPLLGPILMFPFYISIYFVYMFICKILRKEPWIPYFTKKIHINFSIMDKYNIKKNNNEKTIKKYIFYLYILLLIICLIIPIFDLIPAMLLVFLIVSYYNNNNLFFNTAIIISTIFVSSLFLFLFNIKSIFYSFLNVFTKHKIKFITGISIWVIFNVYMIIKNIPKYKKYIKLDEEIKYI